MAEQEAVTDPARIAAEIAPQLDRLRLAVIDDLRTKAEETAQRYAITPPALQTLGMLRNTLPDRVVAIDDVLALFLYSPQPDQVRSAIDLLVTTGTLESARGHAVVVTDKGRSAVHRMFELTQQFIDRLWAGHEELVGAIFPLADRACAAATATGGAATSVVAPPYDPPGASPALLLVERLTPLRFHRYDAHVDAWRAEGLTVEQVQALEPGPQRDRIEEQTNRRAAAPYAALDSTERLNLLQGLETLPS